MKETGILFTPDNIRAIREGRKTQTRRVINPQPETNAEGGALVPLRPSGPYGWIGDRLYVKEGVITHASIPQLVGYYMDGCRVTEHWEKRLTAMFMPKWAARTWLEITEVRVERVQQISNEDARAEGIPQSSAEATAFGFFDNTTTPGHEWDNRTSAENYGNLWDSINGKKHPWAANPWVWALTFKLVKQ